MMSSQRLRRKEVEKPLQSARCSCVWKEFSNVLENMKVGHFGHLNLLAEAAPTQIDDAKKEKPPMKRLAQDINLPADNRRSRYIRNDFSYYH
ncbi:uncharacterized protein LOC144072767 isoform X2 [Stigmatopora argus]